MARGLRWRYRCRTKKFAKMNDLRFALRLLAKSPGFTAIAALTLALGLGATTTVFGWIDTVLLRPLRGVADAGRIATLETRVSSGELIDTSYLDARDYRDHARSLGGVTVFRDHPLAFGRQDETTRAWSQLVSGNFFDVLGVKPELGRFFSPEEQGEEPGAHPVAVISHAFWKNRMQGDPMVIGQTIRLNQSEFTVIGVAPKEFKGAVVGLSYDVWVPLTMMQPLTRSGNWLLDRDNRSLHTLVRLQPGVSLAQAQSEVNVIGRQLESSYPASNRGVGASLFPVALAPYGAQSHLRKPLMVLIAGAVAVLLIVCANLGNLLLARAAGRRQEIAVRLALGASRARLVRQLLAESWLLAALGGALGLGMASWLAGLLNAFVPATNLPVGLAANITGGTFGFAAVGVLLAGVLFGLAPAIQSTSPNLQNALVEGGRGGMGGRKGHRLQGGLVVAEVALALVSLAVAALCLQSFAQTRRINPGFDPENVFLAGVNLATTGYDRQQGLVFYPRLRERLAALPGVEAVSYSERVPLGFEGGSWETISVDGFTPRPEDNMRVYDNVVAPGYFDLLRVPILAGRDFAPRDDERSEPVAIVNETFARRFLGGANPVGRHFQDGGRSVQIVGLVKDGKYRSLSEPAQPYYYRPFAQAYSANSGVALHIRTSVPAATVLSAARRELRSMDPRVAIFDAMPMTEYIGASLFTQKLAAILLGVMGSLALALAAMGLYGVIACAVAQRQREIGLRMALGAKRSDILALVLRRGMKLVAAGVAAGMVAAFVGARAIRPLLVGVQPGDARTFAAITLLLLVVAFLACWLPARRATRIDPMAALRDE
jgi:predicted permease